jgi:ribosome biogenesis GTPase A
MTNSAIHECSGKQQDRGALISSIDRLTALADSNSDLHASLAALSAKLMSNRFSLAVLGQMKRGKSSFINALLGAELLPTGILPLTSVITTVRYRSVSSAYITYKTGYVASIPLDSLYEYITEAENPGNKKQVASADVTYPSPFLQSGIDLIDTPGIGSTHLHNTSITEGYLSKVDAGIMVLSVDPPITAVESEFLKQISKEVPKLFFVINKIDLASPPELSSILEFLRNELCNHLGIEEPELFPISARQSLRKRMGDPQNASSGMRDLTGRLQYFATYEKDLTLSRSVAMDVLRIAGSLKFAALVGERTRSMSGKDLEMKKQVLEEVLTRTGQEMADVHHLLKQDISEILSGIEKDLADHAAAAAPQVRKHLDEFKREHPRETRTKLGTLLDEFLRAEVERVFQGWRSREDEKVRKELTLLSVRFVERTNGLLAHLEKEAGNLFDVPVSHVNFTSMLSMESRFSYSTDHVFQFQLDRLMFALPSFLLRKIVFHRMSAYIDIELNRNSGRIRYDYLERLEQSLKQFQKDIEAAIRLIAEPLASIVTPNRTKAQYNSIQLVELDEVMMQCRSLISGRLPVSGYPTNAQEGLQAM